MIPDWQLPIGVDRGLWDYLHSQEMVRGYDQQMQQSALASQDVQFCQKWFPTPGPLLDLGCGTARLGRIFAPLGYEYTGIDLSDAMLTTANNHAETEGWNGTFRQANIVEGGYASPDTFDYAACLFSTLGMIRGAVERRLALQHVFQSLRIGGVLVLHIHNRWFPGLGWRRWFRSDWTMPQAYGGAPLTLHHFSWLEVSGLFRECGFQIVDGLPIGITEETPKPKLWWQAYGYLIAAKKLRDV